MRVTSSMYYKNLFVDNSKANEKLFDVNKQISSGLKIQYAGDDVNTFTNTMILDNELATLGQVKSSTDSGFKMSNQADTVLNEFQSSLDRTKVLLVQAATSVQSNESLDAIAKELRGIESNFKNLANTSINGQYLFSGSALEIKPIREDGIYMGNDVSMNAFLGSGVQQQYNMTGASLFLGEEILTKREITSNVPQYNLQAKYPDFADPTSISQGVDRVIASGDTIRDLMGSLDQTIDATNHFYLRGVQSDGTAFNHQITMNGSESVDELLVQIGNAYGNTQDLNVVNVSLNTWGEIVVQDKMKGSSKLDFHMVGAVDYDTSDFIDSADINDGGAYGVNVGKIENLDAGETDFKKIINGRGGSLFVKEFVKSPFTPATGAATNITGLNYDRTLFIEDGSKISSNVAQIVKSTNAFATGSTKLSEVADLSQSTTGTLDGTFLILKGTDIGANAFEAKISLRSSANGGSSFSLDGGVTNYDIFNMDSTRVAVDADDMTYKQLLDVTNMLLTRNLPASIGTHISPETGAATTLASEEYDYAIDATQSLGTTTLSYDGQIEFRDENNPNTKASLAMYDSSSENFNNPASVMTFNANNALTVRDAKTDFFKNLNQIITAVEDHKLHPDSSSGDMRNIGIQNSISVIDDLMSHIGKSHSQVGANSNALNNALERTQLLEISTVTLRSSVIDSDLAESSLQLSQLSLNLQAMLSTVAKVSKLSLINYI